MCYVYYMRFSSENKKVLIIKHIRKNRKPRKKMTRLKVICYVGALLLALIAVMDAVAGIVEL